MDEWWKDSQLIRGLEAALETAGYSGLTVGSFGVRIPTAEDNNMTIREKCDRKISSIRKVTNGFDIFLCGPNDAYEVFIRGDKPPGFLPFGGGEGDLADFRKTLEEFGKQLRRGLPLKP